MPEINKYHVNCGDSVPQCNKDTQYVTVNQWEILNQTCNDTSNIGGSLDPLTNPTLEMAFVIDTCVPISSQNYLKCD